MFTIIILRADGANNVAYMIVFVLQQTVLCLQIYNKVMSFL